MTKEIEIGGVCERDLDLFLQEQLLSSPGFCTWFAEETLGLKNISGVAERVERGVTDGTRESDIEATFSQSDGSSVMVLVENKIKANFQPDQYEGYEGYAKELKEKSLITDYRIVLFAPQKYLDGNLKGFAIPECHKVSYEDALVFLERHNSEIDLALQSRCKYKIALLKEAIKVATIGTQKYVDFWETYTAEVNVIAEDFKFQCPVDRSAPGGDTIEFKHSGISRCDWPFIKKPEPVHRLYEGNFGKYKKAFCGEFYIKIPEFGEKTKLNALKKAFEPIKEPHMMILRANQSAAIRIAVPQIKRSNFSENQIPALRSALYLGKNLYNWFLSEQSQEVWEQLLHSVHPE